MTSPYYQTQGGDPYQQYTTQGGGGMDQDALAAMYEQTGQFNQQEADRKYKLGRDQIQAQMKIAGIESGDRRYGIEATRDTARAQLEQARQEMIQIGIPRVAIEKYVAEKNYEIAQSEMQLKRDTLTQDTAQKAAQLQLDREQMERIGIPKMEIDRYVAQSNAEIARGQLGVSQGDLALRAGQATGYYGGQQTLEQRKFLADQQAAAQAAAQSARQFNTTASGYMQQAPTLTAGQQSRYQQLQARDEQIRASGGPGIDPSERTELAGYEDILSGRAPNPQQPGGGGGGQATLDRERFMQDQLKQARRYGLDVSKFGAELASTPDTYFQSRRFQGVDVPRLLGGAGAATQDVAGGPTPGVATMGAYLSGQDPYGQQAQASPAAAAAAPGALPTAAPSAPALPAGPTAQPLSGQEQARWQQLMARDQEIRASGGPGLEGVDLDEAQRFQQRGATYTPPPAGGYGPSGGGILYGGTPSGPQNPAMGGGGMPQMPGGAGYGGPGGFMTPSPGGDYGGDGAMASKPGGGGMFPNIDPVSGGSTLPLSTYGGGTNTTSSYGATPYGGSSVNAAQGYASAMPSWYTQQYGSGGGQGSQYPSQDPRQKQVAALAKAMPPSPYSGLSETDASALRAMESIYKQGGQAVAGGEMERLKASGRMGFMSSAGRLLGYSPEEFQASYAAYRPSQGSSRMAG